MKIDTFFEQLPAWAYFALIPLALVFGLAWGLHFNVWWDIGLYAVLVILLGFGLLGTLVYGHARYD